MTDIPSTPGPVDAQVPRRQHPALRTIKAIGLIRESWVGSIGLGIVIFWVLIAVFAPVLAAYDPSQQIGPLLNVMLGELRKHGLETLDLDGQPFDPEVAEAVAHEPGDGGEIVVADVLRSGYRWKGRTLRPAMVRTRD